jgi:quercetin dioxygenase-like cupin family protein
MAFEPKSVRRIVTGHDRDGRAVVIADGPVSPLRRPDPSMVSSHIWMTASTPADLNQDDDLKDRISGTAPPVGGSRIGVLDIAPGNSKHPPHRTDTVDYVICLFGEVDLDLGESRVTLRAGDVLVQCGTSHAWVNRGDQPARLVFVLLDAVPKREGSLGAAAQAR